MTRDETYMLRALQLAKLGGIATQSNPLVGAVIVLNDKIIGEGYHQKYGEAHAEVNAVNSVADKSLLKEATIYVTLEPCSHFGKTPPCADLLVRYQFKRAVIAQIDPFSEVAGRGIEKLRQAGIRVDCGILEKEAKGLNKRFITFQTKQRPFITLKWAQSKDAFIDLDRTDEQKTGINWISQPETQVVTHQIRSREQAILVGWVTVKNDNPSLTTRAFKGPNPIRIILDSQLQAPKDARVFHDGNQTIVLNLLEEKVANAVRFIKLEKLDPQSILEILYQNNLNSVLIEGGAATLNSFIESGLWDDALVITGENEFKSGLKAPVLSKNPVKTVRFGKDILNYFQNYSF
jgi:diaminohydroxyphosphoribosylaminopyrimidine deaminase/5-amino-6-(5-phosphoribosylamino)uracil reductase